MASPILRRATKADAAALGPLHVLAWQETYTGLLPVDLLDAMSVSVRTSMWERILSIPGEAGKAAVIVVEVGDRLVGFGSYGWQHDKGLLGAGFHGEFHAIYVLQSYQRRGIGRSLLARMSSELIATGITSAALWVLRDNTNAVAFYQKQGGAVVGNRIDHHPNADLVEDAYGWSDLSPLTGF
jgi:ribosomal protein S18 acetylase RimI-like enzyme